MAHRKDDCDALCQCTHKADSGAIDVGCADVAEYCTCTACEVLPVADEDENWLRLRHGDENPNPATRRLNQLATTQLLQDNVDRLSTVQDALILQVWAPSSCIPNLSGVAVYR